MYICTCQVLSEHVKPGSKIASDGWTSTTKTAKDTGLNVLGTCDHGTNFPTPKTGVHSNDAESEVARYKKWHCSKWTSVRTLNTKDQAKKQNHPEGKISCNVLQTNTADARQVASATIIQGTVQAGRGADLAVTSGPTRTKAVSALQTL